MLRKHWRLAVVAAPAGFVLAVTAAACRDALLPDKRPNDAQMTAASVRVDVSANARNRLHARNPHDWVGLAHNQGIEEFRRRLRAPGVLTRSACAYVSAFVNEAERVPSHRSRGTPESRRLAAAEGLKLSPLCRRIVGTTVAPTGHMAPAAEPSPAAEGMLGQIEAAIDAAANSSDLAARLSPLLDAAAGLEETEYVAISTTISVAQSSFEYWESNLAAFVSEVEAEYRDCAMQYREEGSDMAFQHCVAGSDAWQSRARSPGTSASIRLATNPARSCDAPRLGEGMRRIGRADAGGAWSGAWAGAWAGGPAGALEGALIGGAGASIGAGLVSAWQVFSCIMF